MHTVSVLDVPSCGAVLDGVLVLEFKRHFFFSHDVDMFEGGQTCSWPPVLPCVQSTVNNLKPCGNCVPPAVK